VGYSRIYLGVHYPSDILFGALDGCLWGFVFYKLFLKLTEKSSVINA
jgi:undecaprenyl-diphosphatase